MSDDTVQVKVTTDDGNTSTVYVSNEDAREYEDLALRPGNVVSTKVNTKW